MIHQSEDNRVAYIDIPASFSTNNNQEGKGTGNLGRAETRTGSRQIRWDVSSSKGHDSNLLSAGAPNSITHATWMVTYFSLATGPDVSQVMRLKENLNP